MEMRLIGGPMVRLLFRVSGDPSMKPVVVEVPDWWVRGRLGEFELMGEDIYAVVGDEAYWSYEYAKMLGKSWPEMEGVIKGSRWEYLYAFDVLRLDWDEAGRWIDG